MENKQIVRNIVFSLIVAGLLVAMYMTFNVNENSQRKIVGVHIKGEINAPGYYELKYGSRLKDLVILAGGETDNADLNSVNLAMRLIDGEEIVIPTAIQTSKNGKININTADLYNLCKLDGIGEELAERIIEHRATKGEFKSIDELRKVKGINDSKFSEIKNKITVD